MNIFHNYLSKVKDTETGLVVKENLLGIKRH